MTLANKLSRLVALIGIALVLIPRPAYADTQENIGIGIGALVVWLILMLIAREIVCWYYKINQITGLLREIRDELKGDRGSSTD